MVPIKLLATFSLLIASYQLVMAGYFCEKCKLELKPTRQTKVSNTLCERQIKCTTRGCDEEQGKCYNPLIREEWQCPECPSTQWIDSIICNRLKIHQVPCVAHRTAVESDYLPELGRVKSHRRSSSIKS
ncbi:hypothetical protein O181_068360 [Austropuccinia psidii MF-1]|uniref:Uncharacterized protein n=1 Tax=Austropuccinia psidii MF-1 TaxID=1389203 RepID=A0A9Q3ESE6_9BASI|nr:hypothetical protein [Austropuccinia psidii MF-1]